LQVYAAYYLRLGLYEKRLRDAGKTQERRRM